MKNQNRNIRLVFNQTLGILPTEIQHDKLSTDFLCDSRPL